MRPPLRLRRALAIAVLLAPALAVRAQVASPSLTVNTPTLTSGTGLFLGTRVGIPLSPTSTMQLIREYGEL